MKYFPLFFFVFFSSPKLFLDIGSINLRAEDILVYVFFICNFATCVKSIVKVLKHTQYIFFITLLFYMILSLFTVSIFFPESIDNYYLFKTLGSLPYLFVIPVWLNVPEYRKNLYFGAIAAAFIFFTQVVINLSHINLSDMRDSSSIKSAGAFGSLNPNALGTYSVIIFMYIAILKTTLDLNNKILKKISNVALFLVFIIPFMIFTRSNVGILVAYGILVYIFILSSRDRIYVACTIGVLLTVFFSLYFDNVSRFIYSAIDIDFTTGAGTSSRYKLWALATEIAQINPIFGQGMTTEKTVFRIYNQGGMTHNIFLRYLVELGLLGLMLFVFNYIYLAKALLRKIKFLNLKTYKLQLFMLMCFFIGDFFGQVQYFEKLHYMILFVTTLNLNKTELKN
ncbi:MAG: O-antigen ligase [Mariniflexile sp.]|jgi:O-antigen ligase